MKILLSKNINLNDFIEINEIDWSRRSNKFFSKLHSIASYLAMFCPALPDYFINKYSNQNDVVMDNFSGRGTTGLVCREKGRNFVGTDLNPYAFVLTKFKISKNISLHQILKRIDSLKDEYNKTKEKWIIESKKEKYNELKIYYHDDVLSILIFLRETIGFYWRTSNKIDNAILSISLGLMHGQKRKDNSTMYFSLSMPNTISMSPNYVKKYSCINNLLKPNVDVFENIKNRIKNKFDKNIFDNNDFDGSIYFDDATKPNKKIKNNSVSLVVTSPPYLSIVNYRTSNWLKLWLLGFERNELKEKIKLSDSLNYKNYVTFIKNYLNAIHKKLKNKAKVCLIVGDVHGKKLIENVWEEIKDEVKYNFKEIYYDEKYLQENKTTNMLNSKKGKATIIEKVLVLEKNEN